MDLRFLGSFFFFFFASWVLWVRSGIVLSGAMCLSPLAVLALVVFAPCCVMCDSFVCLLSFVGLGLSWCVVLASAC